MIAAEDEKELIEIRGWAIFWRIFFSLILLGINAAILGFVGYLYIIEKYYLNDY
jgi:hypothetical protein